MSESVSDVIKRFMEIPKDKVHYLNCHVSSGAIHPTADPMLIIEGSLHCLADPVKKEEEKQLFMINLDDVRVLKKTIDNFLKSLDKVEEN